MDLEKQTTMNYDNRPQYKILFTGIRETFHNNQPSMSDTSVSKFEKINIVFNINQSVNVSLHGWQTIIL